ncbi:MAG TPA: HAD-IIA family hydrolase [Balneolales bacterium]|nr:HAD-IIA family hydrolase [Balneolales bacterium]
MKNIICDIDGVILKDNSLIEGADTFINRVLEKGYTFLFLTNYSSQTPQDLKNRLSSAGLDIHRKHFYTSAMATAAFLEKQEGRKAYVIGEGGLTHELYNIDFTITDIDPDYVIVGETRSYNWDMIQKAAYLINNGARFIATNPDVAGPQGSPSCGALCAPIERITGKKPFYIGKPNAWMMRAALNYMKGHSENTIIIGDNMKTDILAGIQAGMDTILVLTGVAQSNNLSVYPFQPMYIYDSVVDIDIL